MPTPRVYISEDIARRADVYHTSEDCRFITYSDITEIALATAEKHGARECRECSDASSLNTIQRRLYEMDPDDLLGGGRA